MKLREALRKIAEWELPPTGDTWPGGSPVSYGAKHGSNGERDYMRELARAALAEPVADEPVTRGHCANKKLPGGCPLHNLECGYPECDTRPAAAPAERGEYPPLPDIEKLVLDYGQACFDCGAYDGNVGHEYQFLSDARSVAYRLLCAKIDQMRAYVDALRADAEQLRLSLTFIVDRDLTYFDGYVDRHQISMGAIEQARRVLKFAAAIDAARQS